MGEGGLEHRDVFWLVFALPHQAIVFILNRPGFAPHLAFQETPEPRLLLSDLQHSAQDIVLLLLREGARLERGLGDSGPLVLAIAIVAIQLIGDSDPVDMGFRPATLGIALLYCLVFPHQLVQQMDLFAEKEYNQCTVT